MNKPTLDGESEGKPSDVNNEHETNDNIENIPEKSNESTTSVTKQTVTQLKSWINEKVALYFSKSPTEYIYVCVYNRFFI